MRFVSFAVITRPPPTYSTTQHQTSPITYQLIVLSFINLICLPCSSTQLLLYCTVCLHVLVWTSCSDDEKDSLGPSPDSYACWPTDAHVLSYLSSCYITHASPACLSLVDISRASEHLFLATQEASQITSGCRLSQSLCDLHHELTCNAHVQSVYTASITNAGC